MAPAGNEMSELMKELDESGMTDLVGKVAANVNVDWETVVGVEGRTGANSGPGVSGKGMLEGNDR